MINSGTVDGLLDVTGDLAAAHAPDPVFGVAWLVLFLLVAAVCTAAMFSWSERYEALVFAITAGIFWFLVAIVFTAPVDFGSESTEITITVSVNDTATAAPLYAATIERLDKTTTWFPHEPSLSLAVSAFCGLLGLLCLLYAMMIMGNTGSAGRRKR